MSINKIKKSNNRNVYWSFLSKETCIELCSYLLLIQGMLIQLAAATAVNGTNLPIKGGNFWQYKDVEIGNHFFNNVLQKCLHMWCFTMGCQIKNVRENNSMVLKFARRALCEYVSLVLIIPTLTMLLMVRAVPTAPVVAKAYDRARCLKHTHKTNEGRSSQWLFITRSILYQFRELQNFSFISVFTCFPAWILELATYVAEKLLPVSLFLLGHCYRRRPLNIYWYYILVVYLCQNTFCKHNMAWPSATYTIFHYLVLLVYVQIFTWLQTCTCTQPIKHAYTKPIKMQHTTAIIFSSMLVDVAKGLMQITMRELWTYLTGMGWSPLLLV